jgi:hypothetical protein
MFISIKLVVSRMDFRKYFMFKGVVMSDFYEYLEAIRGHQIASGIQQNLFLIKSTKKRVSSIFSNFFFQNLVKNNLQIVKI